MRTAWKSSTPPAGARPTQCCDWIVTSAPSSIRCPVSSHTSRSHAVDGGPRPRRARRRAGPTGPGCAVCELNCVSSTPPLARHHGVRRDPLVGLAHLVVRHVGRHGAPRGVDQAVCRPAGSRRRSARAPRPRASVGTSAATRSPSPRAASTSPGRARAPRGRTRAHGPAPHSIAPTTATAAGHVGRATTPSTLAAHLRASEIARSYSARPCRPPATTPAPAGSRRSQARMRATPSGSVARRSDGRRHRRVVDDDKAVHAIMHELADARTGSTDHRQPPVRASRAAMPNDSSRAGDR